MARSLDSTTLVTWRQRLAKFDVSGLTVAAYCRQEGITPARFYYWTRRVRELSLEENGRATNNTQDLEEIGNVVELLIGAHVKVRLPGNDRDLIHSVLASLQFSAELGKSGGAFQRIDVRRTSAV